MKVLNLFAGIGGNRFLWPKSWKITAVEENAKVAEQYQTYFPNDEVIVGDAHQYLLDNYQNFDMIWTSPPCPTHSKMALYTRHKKKYPDMMLYQEILFLRYVFKGIYVVENVKSYYEPLIPPEEVGRHYFWTNIEPVSKTYESPPTFKDSEGNSAFKAANDKARNQYLTWLGMPHFEKNIYLKGSHDPMKIVRNCVHPTLGLHIVKGLFE